MLHIFRQGHPFSPLLSSLWDAFDVHSDHLLLIEDGVYLSLSADHLQLRQLSDQGRLSVLDDDLNARGIDARLGRSINLQEWVELTRQHCANLTWNP